MDFSFQIPLPNMATFMRHEEMHFALVHQVLGNHKYAKMMWGCTRPILMDNGVHENGEPAPLEDICKADQLIRADYVIPPDKFHDSEYTKAKFLEAKERI